MRWNNRYNRYNVAPLREKLNIAFKIMRKNGLIARQNYLCCGSCAGYDLTIDAVKRVQSGKIVNGCCFYTRQDNSGLQFNGRVYLGYGCLESTEAGTIGLSTEHVGVIVVDALDRAGLKYEWDGNPDTRILTGDL